MLSIQQIDAQAGHVCWRPMPSYPGVNSDQGGHMNREDQPPFRIIESRWWSGITKAIDLVAGGKAIPGSVKHLDTRLANRWQRFKELA